MSTLADVQLDFVLYAGDPEDGAEAIPSRRVLEELDTLKDKLGFEDGVYGAVTVTRDGEEIGERRPDPIVKLMTNIVRTVPYVLDGEPETALLSESLHGYVFVLANNEVLISFFRGEDAFEPEELLIEQEMIDAQEWSGQIVEMADRLVEIHKRAVPDAYESEFYCRDLLEFLEVGRESAKTYRLERERGVQFQ